jgi:hypothetical protein
MARGHGLSRAVLGARINIEASAALAAWIDIYRPA